MNVNGREPKLALVPIKELVDAAEKLLVPEQTAADMLEISLEEFRLLVHQSLIPYRLKSLRGRRLYFTADLKAYARRLKRQYETKKRPS
jgi:hypothetical protein